MDISDSEKEVAKILSDSKIQVDSIFDERAKADYISAVAKIYDAQVRKQALDAAEANRVSENRFREEELKNERRKASGETASRIVDSVLKFVGVGATVYVGLLNLDTFRECWKESMEFEKTGVFASATFKELRHNLKLDNLKLKFW